jgi:hypothetical protein
MDQAKIDYLNKLNDQVQSLKTFLDTKEDVLNKRESQLRQGQIPNTGPQDLQANMMRALGKEFSPGNVGDINKIIWPFYFTTDTPPAAGIAVDQSFVTGITITQEAAFVAMSFVADVYDVAAGPAWSYITPTTSGVSDYPGLSFAIRDTQSGRDFFNVPMALDSYGNPRFVAKYPRPIMFLPNSNVQVQFFNSHPTKVYAPKLTFFGYRVRIEDAQNLLGLVYG